jgi:hydroxypyruvate reductase
MVGELASAVRPGDTAIILVSGGTTSLIAAPVRGVHEEALSRLFVQLMDAGLDIAAMNAVRKRFLRWGAGRLAVALAPARMHVLLVSDVPGDAPSVIGSGPCAPDEWTVRDVVESLREAKLLDQLAPSLREHLDAVMRGMSGETPKPGHPAFAPVSSRVLASNDTARRAAVARAMALGVEAESGNFALAGEAAHCGERIAHALLERASAARSTCIVWGGEPTVRLEGASAAQGTGGRAQELALAAARSLHSATNAASRISLLAAGTDGRDGPTDAAGAFADARTWQRIASTGGDADAALRQHRSHAVLDAADALFRRAPTGTNVMDLVIGVVE